MTPAGIEPATFRFVAQRLNHCATAVPLAIVVVLNCVNNTTLYILIFGWGGGKIIQLCGMW